MATKQNRLRAPQRALRPELASALHQLKAFPSEKVFRDWSAKRGFGGVKHGSYLALRTGAPAPAEYVGRFVEFCRDTECTDSVTAREIVEEHYAATGIVNLHAVSRTMIVRAISVDPQEIDAFMTTDDFFMDVVQTVAEPRDHARPVDGSSDASLVADVTKAVDWLYGDLGRSVSREPVTIEDAWELAEARIGLAKEAYVRRALSWADHEPWTIVFAQEFEEDVGVTICLPVTRRHYDALRSGHGRPYDTPAAALRSPSAHLCVEAFTMAPLPDRAQSQPRSRSLLTSAILQFVYLSAIDGVPDKNPLRMLGFAGKPSNQRRAESAGFEPTGTHLEGTKIPLLERVFDMRADFEGPHVVRTAAAANLGAIHYLRALLGGSRSESPDSN